MPNASTPRPSDSAREPPSSAEGGRSRWPIVDRSLAEAQRAIALALGGAALAGALLTGALLVADRQAFDPRQEELAARHARALQLATVLRSADAELTLAARLASTTGELRWMNDIDARQPDFEAAVAEALTLAPPAAAQAFRQRSASIQQDLTDLREAAIEARAVGAPEAARRVFDGERFRSRTAAFAAAVGALSDAVVADARSRRDGLRRDRMLLLTGGLAVALLVGGELWRWLRRRLARSAAQLRDVEARIQRLASTDALTGLPNRNAFQADLDAALEAARRDGGELALLIVDLDRFKPVNDRHGHLVGDRVLVQVARRFEHALRNGEWRGRYGGDEFIVAVRSADAAQAGRAVGERLIEALSQPMTVGSASGPLLSVEIGASVGLACYPRDGGDADTLLREADAALYRAKNLGRGRVVGLTAATEPGA